jgi:diphthamide synthase (EF-2-diphthine--ammonia ligase)
MVAAGLRAYLTCVDPKKLDRSFAGRLFDHQLLDELPAAIDPCGENGEFHSFAFAGPMFSHPVGAKSGQILERDGFVFADILSESAAPSLP